MKTMNRHERGFVAVGPIRQKQLSRRRILALGLGTVVALPALGVESTKPDGSMLRNAAADPHARRRRMIAILEKHGPEFGGRG